MKVNLRRSMQVTMTRKKNRCVYNYIPCIHRSVMAKLYWRVKINGKWNWRPAKTLVLNGRITIFDYEKMLEEEE